MQYVYKRIEFLVHLFQCINSAVDPHASSILAFGALPRSLIILIFTLFTFFIVADTINIFFLV